MVAMSQVFVVRAERGSHVWVLESDNGAVSQVRRLDQAVDEMRDAVAYLAGLPVDEVEIELQPVLPPSYQQAMDRAAQLRDAAARAQHEAAAESRRAASALVEAGLSMRDAAHVMGISHQRVAQLVKGAA